MMPKTPGEFVGTYHITGDLTENNCGSQALPAPERLSFDVEIRANKGAGVWLRGSPPGFSGRLDHDGSFEFEFGTTYNVQPTNQDAPEAVNELDPNMFLDPNLIDMREQQAMQHCQLAVDESVAGNLLRVANPDAGVASDASASGAGDSDLVADNQISIHAGAGSNCRAALAAQNGPFEQLPCHASYKLAGKLSQ
jgi:hypothetical protein